jgi:uridylate kinase
MKLRVSRALKVVIKLGGFAFTGEMDEQLIGEYGKVLNEIHSRGHGVAVVTGGGRRARSYIEAARRLGGTETVCDQIGILVSKINALTLISSIGDAASPIVPNTLREAVYIFQAGKIAVSGGLSPAQSTNAVAALIAEAVKADVLIHLTDVEGVYDRDPKRFPDARKMDHVSIGELRSLISPTGIRAGGYTLMDPTALGVIERSKLRVRVASGLDPWNVKRIIQGEQVGTSIQVEA